MLQFASVRSHRLGVFGRVMPQTAPILCALALSTATADAQLLFRQSPAPTPAAPSGPRYNPAAVKMTLQAGRLMEQRKLDEAIVLLDRAVALDPSLIAARRVRMVVRLLQNDMPRALADLGPLIKQNPKDTDLLITRGKVLSILRQYDAAMADFDHALVLDPKSSAAIVGRGLVFRNKGEREKALAEYDRALALNPKEKDAFVGRGIVYREQGQTDKALTQFDQALAIQPKNTEALAERGIALLMKGRAAEATPDLDRALEANPNNLTAMLGRGLAMMATGQPARAVVALDQVIAKSPQNSFAYLLRGKALVTQGEFDRAMADFNEALTIKPKYAEALAARGLVWSKKHEFASALADLDRSIAEEERVESYYTRAQIYESQGNSERAVADFRKAIELPPKGLFDALAQVNAKKRIEQLGKSVPCGSSGRGGVGDTCL
jgi:tetratricopeptide (TPR) repeat protein